MWKEIISVFSKDNLYQQAFEEACEMLDTDGKMFEASVESLRQSDNAEIKVDIYALDKEINRSERDVRKKVMKHLLLSGDQHLAAGLALISVVIDIERIGDYTKNIYDLAVQHPKKLSAGSLEETLSDMEKSTQEFLNKAIDAFKSQDIDAARKLMVEYKTDIASTSNEVVNTIISRNYGDYSADKASAVCLYVRYLKRIAAHSRNLVSSVVNPFERIGYPE